MPPPGERAPLRSLGRFVMASDTETGVDEVKRALNRSPRSSIGRSSVRVVGNKKVYGLEGTGIVLIAPASFRKRK